MKTFALHMDGSLQNNNTHASVPSIFTVQQTHSHPQKRPLQSKPGPLEPKQRAESQAKNKPMRPLSRVSLLGWSCDHRSPELCARPRTRDVDTNTPLCQHTNFPTGRNIDTARVAITAPWVFSAVPPDSLSLIIFDLTVYWQLLFDMYPCVAGEKRTMEHAIRR